MLNLKVYFFIELMRFYNLHKLLYSLHRFVDILLLACFLINYVKSVMRLVVYDFIVLFHLNLQ